MCIGGRKNYQKSLRLYLLKGEWKEGNGGQWRGGGHDVRQHLWSSSLPCDKHKASMALERC